ncbi:unnamed protein product [Brachionus calyciflorus]|uniref:Ubiquinone biosynthesis protein n=1 Tax=Brachionus calyciflorus TaxID=104777 RepID=A0A813LVT8_9BILA|nr:unnamed protein product [Brachionus calyciflorus]
MLFKRLILMPRLVKTSSICLKQERTYLAVSLLNNKLRLRQISFNNNQILRFESIGSTGPINEKIQTDTLNQNESNENEESVEEIILKNALKFVPEYGFTTEAISKGAMEVGLSSAAKGIFNNGAFDLIDFFYKHSNKNLEAYLENLIQEGKIKRKNELIRSAIVYRLTLIQPYIKHWPQAMAIQTFIPSNALVSIENLLKLCDQIWHQVGDNSIDINWYTKRLTLAAVYKTTELFMIQDKSENFKDTYEFLDNRLKDLGTFNQVKSNFSNLAQAVNGSLTVLRNVLNLRN